MNAFMWRLARIATLAVGAGVSLAIIVLPFWGWTAWLLTLIIVVALVDLWLERIKPAGSDN